MLESERKDNARNFYVGLSSVIETTRLVWLESSACAVQNIASCFVATHKLKELRLWLRGAARLL